MSEDYKSGVSPEENDIVAARKRKVQGFKLNINDDFLGSSENRAEESSANFYSDTTDFNVSAILNGLSDYKEDVTPEPASIEKKSSSNDDFDSFASAYNPEKADIKTEPQPIVEAYPKYEEAMQSEAEDSQLGFKPLDASEVMGEYSDDISSQSDGEEISKENMNKEERSALRSYKKAEKKRKKQKAERNGCMFKIIWMSMVIVIAVVLGFFIWNDFSDLLGISRPESENSVVIDLPENANIDQVVDILVENDLIKEPGFFRLYAKLTKSESDFKEGIHSMDTNMDYEAIINTLQSGRKLTDTVQIQFKEGLTLMEYAEILEDKKVCKADKFLELCNSDEFDDEYDFVKAIPKDDKCVYKLEGYLFPDTYDFYIGEDPEDTIRRFLNNFQQKVCVEKSNYDGYSEELTIQELAENKDMQLHDVIKMASLVQAESANEKDMYVVSSIFYNRLATVPYEGTNEYGDGELDKLKSDATLYYPYSSEDDIPQEIKPTFKSNYNTYNIKGLPPGAICAPGIKAIDAAVNPDSTDYYYFCHKAATADSPAEAFYAITYDQHQINMVEAGLED